MINVDELFEKRYGGKTARQYFEENEYFTPIEMVKFAKYCIEQLHKPVVMQAEGSDGANEAAVGQRSVGQSVRGGCVHNFLHYVGPWYTCDDCGAHFHARAEAPSEGALDF